MDCGPAALKAVLEGFGIPASYGRLREACQTSVDGTSIDTLEELACSLGLDAEQIMIPVDHVLDAEHGGLPGIAVTTQPNGSTHFVVVWRKHGGWLQVMDPTIGRRWVRESSFLNELYVHKVSVPARDWFEWTKSEEFRGALRHRMQTLGLGKGEIERRIGVADAQSSWSDMAALDAAVRMGAALVEAGAIDRGKEVCGLIAAARPEEIPEAYWTAYDPSLLGEPAVATSESSEGPVGGEGERPAGGPGSVTLVGALLIRLRGTTESAPGDEDEPELRAITEDAEERPGAKLLEMLRQDGVGLLLTLIGGSLLAASGVLLEALLFRSMLDLGEHLTVAGQRLTAVGGVVALGVALLFLDLPISQGLWRIGRRLEVRLRIAFLEKLPRLGDRYFSSRLSSDMAERSHSIHQLRNVGSLFGALTRTSFELLFVTLGILWLDPASAPYAVTAAIACVFIPILAQRGLAERDLRVRSHTGALSRFYLDSLLGLVPIRSHSAEDTMRREHESLLSEWTRAGLRLQRRTVAMLGWQLFISFGFAILLVLNHLRRGSDEPAVLLLVFWALSLPVLGQEIALLWSRYPWQRNITLRLLEPLGALEGLRPEAVEDPGASSIESAPRIVMSGVAVTATGHRLLSDIDLEIPAGSHVAIVGRSGAGKSSLLGLLLGWHRPASGSVEVAGRRLTADVLESLRRQTAWVDPTVRLWNRTLLENVSYGNDGGDVGFAIDRSLLEGVLKSLPDGMQTVLGEGGAMVSGGEGQRVRLARAMVREDARLVILDEPFRGLPRDVRETLLERSRELWRDATLFYASHDILQTVDFDHVVVIEGGRIVEQGRPQELRVAQGAYTRLLEEEETVQSRLWHGDQWRRLVMEGGRLTDPLEDLS